MAENTDEFIPRPYQIDLYEQAIASNVIIYLPTGSGKTYIAVMVLKTMSADLLKTDGSEKKLSVFLVNTVPLVVQQAKYIKRMTHLSCGCYSGDMNVDDWSNVKWQNEFSNNHVLVMTAQIFLNLLCIGYLQLDRVNLIIFDECHRAVKDHVMRQIMKRFEMCEENKQPKVLGLTATLLNSNLKLSQIQSTVRELEITFNAKIATVSCNSEVNAYCAKPKEIIEFFVPYTTPAIEKLMNDHLEEICGILKLIDAAQSNVKSTFQPKSSITQLINKIRFMEVALESLGIYGCSKAILIILIELEYLKKYSQNTITTYAIEYLITQLTRFRKVLENEMINYSTRDQIHKFSSEKVKKLFFLLKKIFNESQANGKLHCIIFVQRKSTAAALYHILTNLKTSDEKYEFLSVDYMIGFSNKPGSITTENLCLAKWNKEVLAKFRSGKTNCLISTNLIDEGIDIPQCKYIIRFDEPTNFREYVQSKGRAREKESEFIILLSKSNTKYMLTYEHFTQMESFLKLLLTHNSTQYLAPTADEIQAALYEDSIPSYKVTDENGLQRVLTCQQVVSTINKYCRTLFRSKYSTLSPIWELYTVKNVEGKEMFKVSIQLPIDSPVKDIVCGDSMSSIRFAKRSAAMKMCIRLIECGELSRSLTPRIENVIKDSDYLFPNWDNKDEEEIKKIGSYKKKRQYELQFPSAFYEAFPIPGKQLHLHILYTEPMYSATQDCRSSVFYNLLSSKACYGILSTKKMPQIPQFPIFMNVGKLNVNVRVNHSSMVLSEEEIKHAHIFHSTIFRQIVEVIKTFMIFDCDNRENSFLIVPVNENWEVDWEVIRKYKCIDFIAKDPSVPVRQKDYELALVLPNYRGSSNVYVVTQVYDDLTPKSSFPTEDFYSYASYYQDKHGLNINDLEQPMLEVKPISKKINCIKPRSVTHGLSKRKRADILDDFEEELVPELCHRINFPALYWLKATTLPSILHRISQFIIALDLRTTIINETGLGSLESSEEWPPLNIFLNGVDQPSNPVPEIPLDESIEVSFSEVDSHGPEVDVLDTETNMYPWTKGQEPPNLSKNIDQIQVIDIEYYYQFMNSVDISDTKSDRANKEIDFMKKPNVPVPELLILKQSKSDAPDPVQIVQALTTKLGNDVFDLERLETLGDSYLKFITTLFLYSEFPLYTEGVLTTLKGKIVGNRNLFYCGRNKKIPGRMKVDEFIPLSNFIAPAYTVFRPLQKILLHTEVPPNVLYEINIPIEESLSGHLSEKTKIMMQETVTKWDATESHTGMEHYLGVQIVSDKAVADCVEALIGVYLTSMGIENAGELLKWFGILPKTLDTKRLLHGKAENPMNCEGNPLYHMPWASLIENKLGYKFKNPAFLLMAYTHPSYSANRMTDSYNRLEFLGDALLDFLITCHIYDRCGNLTPGMLTDLRSALVNNITFACLVARYGLHIGLLSYSPILTEAIDRFVKFQSNMDFVIFDNVYNILLEEDDCAIAEQVDVPKVLGDIFESLIGAIYLDSGKDLKCVWNIVYSLMHREIDEFSKNVPKQPVRLLTETQGVDLYFSKAIQVPNMSTVVVTLKINTAGKTKYFNGFGLNKKQAKNAAAKQALKFLWYKE